MREATSLSVSAHVTDRLACLPSICSASQLPKFARPAAYYNVSPVKEPAVSFLRSRPGDLLTGSANQLHSVNATGHRLPNLELAASDHPSSPWSYLRVTLDLLGTMWQFLPRATIQRTIALALFSMQSISTGLTIVSVKLIAAS